MFTRYLGLSANVRHQNELGICYLSSAFPVFFQGRAMIVTFKNWDKYNIRQKDIKRPFWFAMSNSIFMDPLFADFNDQQKLTFIYLLAEASRQNKYGEVEIVVPLYSRITGYKETVLVQVLDKLLKSGRAAESRLDGGKIATATQQDITLQDKTKGNIAPSVFSKQLEADFSDLIDLFNQRQVKPKLVEGWVKAFPDVPWIKQEVFKAIAWEDSNPVRKKKNFGAFLTRWMTSGWDRRKTDPVKKERDWSFLKD